MKKQLKQAMSLVLAVVLVLSMLPMAAQAEAYTGIMRQTDDPWWNYSFNGGTLAATGCGIFSLANAVGYLTGEKMDVVEIATWAHNNGMYNVTGADGTYRTSFYQRASARYGPDYGFAIDCSSDGGGYWSGVGDALLKNHLESGGTAVVHVYNHFMCLVDYDRSSNKFHLYDCAPRDRRGTLANGGDLWFTEAQLSSGYTDVDWYCLVSADKSKQLEGNDPIYLGEDFMACIRHTATEKYITNVNNNLQIEDGTFGTDRDNFYPSGSQLFHFYRNHDGSYSMCNDEVGKWFDVSGGIYADGTNLQLWEGNGLHTQRFYIYFINGSFYFRTKSSNKVFDVSADTGNLALWGEDTGTNEAASAARAFEILKLNSDYSHWYRHFDTDQVVYVRNLASGKLMTGEGTDVSFQTGTYTNNQKWKMLRRADGSYEFVNVATGKYLEVTGGGISTGTTVNSGDGNGHPSQGFYVLPSDTTDAYVLKPCYSDNVLDMGADSYKLALYPPHLEWEVPRAAQLFEIVFTGIEGNSVEPAHLGYDFRATITNPHFGRTLTDMGTGALEAQTPTAAENQIFTFHYDAATDAYEIVGSSGMAVEVVNTAYANDSVMGMSQRNDWIAQRFRLYEVDGGYAISPVYTNRLVDVFGGDQTTMQLCGTELHENRTFRIDVKEIIIRQITLRDDAFYEKKRTLVKNVTPETSVADLLSAFTNEDLLVLDADGNELTDVTSVGTGYTVNLFHGDELMDQVTLAVCGDIDGNGRIDNTDYMRIKSTLLTGFTLNDAEKIAADVDGSGMINTTDYLRIKAHFLKTFDLRKN